MLIIRSTTLFLCIAAGGLAATAGAEKPGKYVSERSQYPFLGATQVILSDFAPMGKETSTAKLLLDANELTFSAFGDVRITAVLYKPVEVKLTRVKADDPTGKDRRVFAVELPRERAELLNKRSLQLVWPVGEKGQPAGVRLLVLDPAGKVMQTLELRLAREI
jgi:hypothetical protein